MAITILLSDPGMHSNTVSIGSLEEIPLALKTAALNNYTEAGLHNDEGKLIASATREVGETDWVLRSTRHGRAMGMT